MAILGFGKTSDIETPADIEAASLRSDKFRLERQVDWQRLDAIVTALEKGRPRAFRMMICWKCQCSIAKPPPVFQWRAKPRWMQARWNIWNR